MGDTKASLCIEGPMTKADMNRILYGLRIELWKDLHNLLVEEDDELRYGFTTFGGRASA